MDYKIFIEIIGTLLNLIFLILVIKENIWCWIFGIVGSLVSIILFIQTKLYSEAILYSYYVIMGVYGWIKWNKKSNDEVVLQVTESPVYVHIIWIVVCFILLISLGWFFDNYTDANNPYMDAFTTIFAFLATYFEAIKLRSAWYYWIVINGVSIWLYLQRGLEIYSILMFVYFILSFVGLISWHKSYKKAQLAISE
ncbi:nicotinamide riboside transporter PnuC [bacterium]|nr:MAG: nicotinamide riboside transporter PnuC [bacterium]